LRLRFYEGGDSLGYSKVAKSSIEVQDKVLDDTGRKGIGNYKCYELDCLYFSKAENLQLANYFMHIVLCWDWLYTAGTDDCIIYMVYVLWHVINGAYVWVIRMLHSCVFLGVLNQIV